MKKDLTASDQFTKHVIMADDLIDAVKKENLTSHHNCER
jgi:hypothetical protein